LLKNATHLALTASMSAFCAAAGAISPTKKAITSASLRMINSSSFALYPTALLDHLVRDSKQIG
jgi:hypothetical protein